MNSEDDVSDEDPSELFDTDNVIVCQYDKVCVVMHSFIHLCLSKIDKKFTDNSEIRKTRSVISVHQILTTRRDQVRSGMGAYAGAARRRVHLATGLLGSPSGHRLGSRQARHAHILQIGLRLAITQADATPVMSISFR